MLKKYSFRLLEKIETSPLTFSGWLTTFSSLVAVRLLVEFWLGKFSEKSLVFLFYEFAHTFLFFAVSYLLFFFLLRFFLKEKTIHLHNFLLFGFIIIIFPPLIDFLFSQGKGFWSFYDFGSLAEMSRFFFTFFDDTPTIGITYGVRIEIAISLFFLFFYFFVKNLIAKKNTLNKTLSVSLLGTFSAYVAFFILGTLPAWIAIVFLGWQKGFFSVNAIDTAQMFLTPARIFTRDISEIISALNIKMSLFLAPVLTFLALLKANIFAKEKLLAMSHNARWPQIFYHLGILIIGLGLGLKFSNYLLVFDFFNLIALLNLAIAVVCAWLASVVFNDLFDTNIDSRVNQDRPLIQNVFSEREYKNLGCLFFAISLFFASLVSFKAGLLLLAYQALAWIYSAYPLRFKRIPLLASFISATASLTVFFAGFTLASPTQSLTELPTSIIWLLLIGYTLSLPIKDFKDVAGDKQDGVATIPVIFGEEWGKIVTASGIFLSFLTSVILLNETRLFPWALLCGGIAFWLINKMERPEKNRRLNYKNIFWWLLVIIFIYAGILIKISLS